MTDQTRVPVIKTEADIEENAGKTVYIEGIYQQEDVRMMQVNPETLFLGHVVVVLDDGCPVFLYPPATEEARRSQEEIQQFENKKVRVLGLLYPSIPQEGAIQIAPCLTDIQSIVRSPSL